MFEARTGRGSGSRRHENREPARRRLIGGRRRPVRRCRYCGHAITEDRFAVAMGAAPVTRHANPAGVIFEVGCFRRADGCIVDGAAIRAFSWFPGFAWCYAQCAACREHLGWHYEPVAAGEPFFGLILNKLSPQGEP